MPTLEKEVNWTEITDEYLVENFINADPNTPQNLFLDMDKVDFRPTAFDKHYYKKRFPLFDDSICEILEKCSIDKQNNKTKVHKPPSRNPRDFCISLD